jgi:hypothetical protein
MTPLDWKDAQSKPKPHSSSGGTNLWFGITMTLLGLIMGFMLVMFIR